MDQRPKWRNKNHNIGVYPGLGYDCLMHKQQKKKNNRETGLHENWLHLYINVQDRPENGRKHSQIT